MRGARPLKKQEVLDLKTAFSGRNKIRNLGLFLIGVNTGFRISELLSLTRKDVVDESGRLVDRLTVQRRHMKGAKASRSIIFNDQAKAAIKVLLREMESQGFVFADDPLFRSERTGRPIDRVQAYRVLKAAYRTNGLRGRLSTHTMRKTFANAVYSYFKGLVAKGEPVDAFRSTSKALGHADIKSTDQYLSFLVDDIDDAVKNVGV